MKDGAKDKDKEKAKTRQRKKTTWTRGLRKPNKPRPNPIFPKRNGGLYADVG